MRVITAKILDSTHLELSQPLNARPGEVIEISLPSETDDELVVWQNAAKRRLLEAYSEEDAVYDQL
jgi:hypothetical protein